MYIDESGKLNIFILNGDKLGVEESDIIVFNKADYSLQELTNEMERLGEYVKENKINCPEFALDESLNRISVILYEADDLSGYNGNSGMLSITVDPDYKGAVEYL